MNTLLYCKSLRIGYKKSSVYILSRRSDTDFPFKALEGKSKTPQFILHLIWSSNQHTFWAWWQILDYSLYMSLLLNSSSDCHYRTKPHLANCSFKLFLLSRIVCMRLVCCFSHSNHLTRLDVFVVFIRSN